MDFNITSPFTMVVLIVLIGVTSGVVTTWLKTREKMRVDPAVDEELHRLRQDVARLNERVRTLEKIATDPEQRLREDFSRLA